MEPSQKIPAVVFSLHFPHRRRHFTLLCLAIFLVWPLAIDAQPGEGVGLFLGGSTIKAHDSDTGKNYSKPGSGFGGGIDYQFTLGNLVSLNPFYTEITGEGDFPQQPDLNLIKYAIAGMELRVWIGPFFLSAHRGWYTAALSDPTVSSIKIGTAQGSGTGVGLEFESGLFLTAHSEQANQIDVSDGPTIDISGTRLNIGYRWK